MTTLTTVLLVIALISGYLLLCWLDNKYHLRLIAWCNGQAQNPFSPDSARKGHDKDKQIRVLQERIEVLETLVTDPSWLLQQEFRKLETPKGRQ